LDFNCCYDQAWVYLTGNDHGGIEGNAYKASNCCVVGGNVLFVRLDTQKSAFRFRSNASQTHRSVGGGSRQPSDSLTRIKQVLCDDLSVNKVLMSS